ncbi:HD-GYP domain-containing protein [Butyrivibrio sp. AE2032]|uniref:HD-GYP domain-containing protein n=1 Tax=Butyrivibrio sp. AE2032 TaxID=1458463 RepID=UPI00068D208C|nr:HD domain-containing phosphohydrolase [Butyrivibrio sp. AE2032]
MSKKHHKGLSIKIVTAIYSVAVIVVLTIITVIVGYRLYEKHVMEHYSKYTTTVLEYAYSVTKEYSFGDMIAAREMPDAYEQMRAGLNHVKESSEIDYLYAVYFDDVNDINSLTYAINTKTAKELENGGTYTYLGTPCEEGSFQEDTLLTLHEAVLTKRQESGVLQGYSEGYGYMFNGYKVIFDSNDEPAGLLCVEINVSNIKSELNRYIRNIALFVAAFTIIITIIFVALSEYYIIYPITKLTDSAKDFIRNIGNQESIDRSVRELKSIDIRSENEIGELYKTVSKMESDMADQYRDIRQYSENVMKMQDGLIILMADMVEKRDSDTGDHIQKTAAYVRIILRGLKRKGYYLEKLTPQYMEYVEKSAPLHDVGKIRIPDAVLNKPGKLTPEEYEIMKTHASAGKEIINKAITTVEGETYLREACNMAAYHHERWDGTGYPEGLKGEEIPLSARVMAVADVFDALCSRRIYKPAFPIEDALKIIEEGKGTQFDPKCVEVFLEALPDIKAVLRKYHH